MDGNALVGRSFRVTGIIEGPGDVPIVERTEPMLSFTEVSFQAHTGCNRLWAEYEVDGEGRLIAGEIRQTLIGCTGDRLRQEDRIRRALAGHPRIEIQGDTVTFRTAALVLVAVAES